MPRNRNAVERGLQGTINGKKDRDALACDFIISPFNVLSARDGFWTARKRQWRASGLLDAVSRENLHKSVEGAYYGPKTGNMNWLSSSIFDPVLTEVLYNWFCPQGGHVFDPFAGGAVRGVVASLYSRTYTGMELRADQIAANRAQAFRFVPGREPKWIEGDAMDTPRHVAPASADFLFSCPPYGDLEAYSDDPRDLSNMDWRAFLDSYQAIIQHGADVLKPDRFVCFVVGDFRDRKGFYRGFVGETVRAFESAGLRLYNKAQLLTALGTVPVRARGMFEAARKLANCHQTVLVFVKGDPKAATANLGDIHLIDLPLQHREPIAA